MVHLWFLKRNQKRCLVRMRVTLWSPADKILCIRVGQVLIVLDCKLIDDLSYVRIVDELFLTISGQNEARVCPTSRDGESCAHSNDVQVFMSRWGLEMRLGADVSLGKWWDETGRTSTRA